MCTTGDHLKVLNQAHMKTDLQFQDWGVGGLSQSSPMILVRSRWKKQKTCITSRKIKFSRQTKKCAHLAAFWKEKYKLKNKNEKKTKNNSIEGIRVEFFGFSQHSFVF